MEILVCLKQVPDDSVEIHLKPGTEEVNLDGVTPVVNAFDTYALEMATRLKEAVGGSITAITVGQPVATKKVAQRLSAMCTVTYADVMAVLGELPGVMAELMSQGRSVRLDGLGTFRYTLATKGVTNEDEFDFQKQVRAVRVQFVPQREGAQTKGSTSTRGLVPSDIEWMVYDASLEASGGASAGGGTDEGEGGSPL